MADFSKEALPFFHDFLAAGFNDGLIAGNVFLRKAEDILPIIAG